VSRNVAHGHDDRPVGQRHVVHIVPGGEFGRTPHGAEIESPPLGRGPGQEPLLDLACREEPKLVVPVPPLCPRPPYRIPQQRDAHGEL
jgi:hypothetical protein